VGQDVIACPRCDRRTPAARGTCLYCGEQLPVSHIDTAPPQRNIDADELAFNAVLEPAGALQSRSTSALASALKLSLEEAEALAACSKPMPVARCQTRQEAEMIAVLLGNCGFDARVIGDEELGLVREKKSRGETVEIELDRGALRDRPPERCGVVDDARRLDGEAATRRSSVDEDRHGRRRRGVEGVGARTPTAVEAQDQHGDRQPRHDDASSYAQACTSRHM